MGTQFIVGSSYLAYWSPPERTTLYQGLYGSGFNIGITLSFLLAGPQVELLGWRGVFLVPGALTALATLVLGFSVIEPRDKPVGPSVTLGRLLELPVLKLTLLGVCNVHGLGDVRRCRRLADGIPDGRAAGHLLAERRPRGDQHGGKRDRAGDGRRGGQTRE